MNSSEIELFPYVCINETGFLPGYAQQAIQQEQTRWQQIAGSIFKSTPPEEWSLELSTLGPTDLTTLHVVPHFRYLAVPTSMGPAQHMRVTGAALPIGAEFDRIDEDPKGLVTRRWTDISSRKADLRLPFVAVVFAKIDPLVNLLYGHRVVETFIHNLSRNLTEGLEDFNQESGEALKALPGEVNDWPNQLSIDRKDPRNSLVVLPLIGLDTTELVLLVRVRRLDLLMRVAWTLRRAVLQDVCPEHRRPETWEKIARAYLPLWRKLRPELDRAGQVAGWLADTAGSIPLMARTSTTLGMPRRRLLEEPTEIEREKWAALQKETAFRRGSLLTQLRVLPGQLSTADRAIRALKAAHLLQPDASQTGQGVYSVLGRQDIVYSGTQEGPEPTPGTPTLPFQIQHFIRHLSVQGLPQRIHHFTTDTTLLIKAFPPGVRPHNRVKLPEVPLEQSPNHLFYQALSQTQLDWLEPCQDAPLDHRIALKRHSLAAPVAPSEHWVPAFEEVQLPCSPYRLLLNAASRGQWTYSMTNAAVNLLVSMQALLGNRVEVEAFLDLAEPLTGWLLEVNRSPESLKSIQSIYDRIDRLIRTRGTRDGAHRRPDIVRSFEARAGQVLIQNALLVLLTEILRQRSHQGSPPLLVNGANAPLSVEIAMGSSVFIVSSMFTQQPCLWPAVAHECEHVRQASLQFDEAWRAPLFAWVGQVYRQTGQQAELPEGTFEDVLQSIIITTQQTPAAPGRGAWEAWQDIVASVVESSRDLGILDGPTLPFPPGHPRSELRPRYFIRVLMPNLIMEISDIQPGEEPERLLRHLSARWMARVATALALYHFPTTSIPTLAEVRKALTTTLETEAPGYQAVHVAIRDVAERFGCSADLASTIFDNSVCALRDLLKEQDWILLASLLHRARLSTPVPYTDGAAQGIAEFLIMMSPPAGERPFYRVHPRGGLHPECPAAQTQEEQRISLLNAMRLSIQRWRGLSLQALLAGGRHCSTGCDTDTHEQQLNAPDPTIRPLPKGPRWVTVVTTARYRQHWNNLLESFILGGQGISGIPFLEPCPWADTPTSLDARLSEMTGLRMLQQGLMDGPRLVLGDDSRKIAVIISLDPACLLPAKGTRVPYHSLVHYCHTLLDHPPADSTDEVIPGLHRHIHPPPKVWVNGALLLRDSLFDRLRS